MDSRLRFNLLREAECRSLRGHIDGLARQRASRSARPEESRAGARDCLFAWIPREPDTAWLHERIEGYARGYAADRGIDVERLYDPLQAVVYDAGCRFDWHTDVGKGDAAFRKLTVSVQLSDERDYDGGDLVLVGEAVTSLRRMRGCASVFPAILGHRVTEITRGRRYAVVGWMLGPPFR